MNPPLFLQVMKKNEIVRGTCIDYSIDGLGILKVDGFSLFVKNLMVGEEAEVIVTALKKNYGFAHMKTLIKASLERVIPICPLFPRCGGCQIQHFSSQAQAHFKENSVKGCFQRIAGRDIEPLPILSMDDPFAYRNKVIIPVSDHPYKTGFYRINSHDIIDMETCYIQSESQNKVYQWLKAHLEEYLKEFPVRYLMMREGYYSCQLMIVFVVWKDCEMPEELLEQLTVAFPVIRSVQLCINDDESNKVLNGPMRVVYGNDVIEDTLLGLTYQISAHSFYQINPKQTERLYQTAIDFGHVKATDTVLDLYCGIGTIGSTIAKQTGAKVIGVEIVPQAIEDAKRNAAANHLDNITFICSDAQTSAGEFARSNEKIDIIFVDPPRKGCDESTLQSIISMNPRTVVYVSCDPATLARDVKVLEGGGYHLEVVQPVDMFPQTKHVECITLLIRK